MNRLMQALSWLRHDRALNAMTDMEQFQAYLCQVNAEKFSYYKTVSLHKKAGFSSVIAILGLGLKGIRFLDLGTGYGDCLDLCHEHAANFIAFTELDPFFFTYNRLKKYATAYHLNHLIGLYKLGPQKFDLIWVKGSISADFFVLAQKLPIHRLWLTNWLKQLDGLAASGGNIVICPHWKNDHHRRKIKDVRGSVFTSIMLLHGYEILPEIRHHTSEPEYPISFHKHVAVTDRSD